MRWPPFQQLLVGLNVLDEEFGMFAGECSVLLCLTEFLFVGEFHC